MRRVLSLFRDGHIRYVFLSRTCVRACVVCFVLFQTALLWCREVFFVGASACLKVVRLKSDSNQVFMTACSLPFLLDSLDGTRQP